MASVLINILNNDTVDWTISQNPHPDQSMAWACWIIARLGGWSGYASQRPTGVITLRNGLERFDAIYFGWRLSRDALVYKR